MHLLPRPKKIEIKESFLETKSVNITNLCSDKRIEKALTAFEKSDAGTKLVVKCTEGNSEGYILDICESGITISAETNAGVFYGIQTLKQIFENSKIPYLHIEDEPDMAYRGFYHDVTRGKVPTVETLKKLIDTLAYYKMNSLQLYVEHTFPFKEFGDDVQRWGFLTADEIKELDDYCYDNFIEFIPSIATFGHIYELLQREEYRELQAIDNFEVDQIFWHQRMAHHTIDPTNPKSIELIKSLIDQYLPLFRTDRFNICGDETFDLSAGKHKGKDTGRLYIDFVKQIISHLRAKGKRVMMWGDVLLQHPETIKELPDGIEFLNWNYGSNPDENQIKVFADLGCTQIVCPGTLTWSRLVEGCETANSNIGKMLDYGKKYNALGMLNTNWGDFGNPCAIELSKHGLVFGAAKSWNTETTVDNCFEESINFLEYKNENAVKYIVLLDRAHKNSSWNDLVWCYSNLIYEKQYDVEYPGQESVEESLSLCREVMGELSEQTWERDEYRSELLIAAEGIMIITELLAYFAGYRTDKPSNISDWLKKYRESWLKSNKESELGEIEKMFNYFDAL